MGKDFWRSKTFWFNVLALIVMVANPLGFESHVPDQELASYAAAIITVINIILRFATSQPITFKRQ